MKRAILLTIMATLLNCAYNKANGYINISFKKETEKLPAKIIFDETYYDKTGNLFFLNRDYMNSYSEIAEYDVIHNKLYKTIFATDDSLARINEFDNDKENIVWTNVRHGDPTKADIFIYSFYTKAVTKIKEGIVCGSSTKGIFPLSLTVDNGNVLWIEHDFEKQTTSICTYTINNNKMHTILSSLNNKNAPMGISNFFVKNFNDYTLFDNHQENGALELFVMNPLNDSIISKIHCPEDILFHYTGIYNYNNAYCVLYAKSKEVGDHLYVHDFKDAKSFRIVGFDKNSYIYDDKIRVFGKEILYTVQLETSGEIADHYYSEIYNLKSMTMQKYERGIDIVKSAKYLALLRINKVKGINQIDFEISKNN